MAECEVHRRTTVLATAGVGADTVAVAGEAWRCILSIVAAGKATDEVTERLATALGTLAAADDLRAYEVPEYAREDPMVSPVPPLVPVSDLVAMVAGDPAPELTYDPAEDYARLTCPVTLHYGAEDSNVPVATSVRRIEAALAGADIQPSIHVYPGLEHMLNVVTDISGLTPETAMLGFHEFQFGPQLWPNLTSWLRRTVGAVSV
jgi:pimeloyl-ACP methyl ester carboxylesterase